jgi:hypothetical protein
MADSRGSICLSIAGVCYFKLPKPARWFGALYQKTILICHCHATAWANERMTAAIVDLWHLEFFLVDCQRASSQRAIKLLSNKAQSLPMNKVRSDQEAIVIIGSRPTEDPRLSMLWFQHRDHEIHLPLNF